MDFSSVLWARLVAAMAVSAIASCLLTPPVKNFAERIGAIDMPDTDRHLHACPTPRMGGLAIFLGFTLSVLMFVDISTPVMGLLMGAVLIAAMGAVDDIVNLKPWIKLLVQILAAFLVYRCGVSFSVVTNPVVIKDLVTIPVGVFALPLTVLWIVGCTNAVNLIDGLDGLAAGISAISSLSMLVVSLFVSEPSIAVVLAALTGACLGFIPFNTNPAKIFMGDVGSQLLGFLLAVLSIMGMFKLHTLVTFLVPVLALAIPLADTAFAFFRRLLHGQSPFHADHQHIHHRLLAMGFNQKQAVALLYGISALLGLIAVLLTGRAAIVRTICLVLALLVSVAVWLFVLLHESGKHGKNE